MIIWERNSKNRLVKRQLSWGEINHFSHIMEPINVERTLIDHFSPISANPPSCIIFPETNATHFELKPSIIQLLPSFYGLDREDPYMHVKDFLEICSTFRFQNFSDESVRLRLFPFSLKDKSKGWLNSLPARSITTWDELVNKFLAKFFPMSKTDNIRREISEFYQKDHEEFYECWERFKDLLLKCPHHGFEKWRLVKYFYDGLTPSNRQMVQSMHTGKFLHFRGDEAWESLDTLSVNSQQWNCHDPRSKTSDTPKRGGIYDVKDDVDIKTSLANLTRRVEAMSLSQSMNNPIHRNEVCSLCYSTSHNAQSCPSVPIYQEAFSEEVKAFQTYGKSTDDPYAQSYNPNWRNHPNFSWRQNQPQMNQGHQYNPPNQSHAQPNMSYPQPQRKPSLEDTMQQFMQTTQQFMQSTQQALQTNSQSLLKLETQIGQLATVVGEREKGKFPSQPVPNPKSQYEVSTSKSMEEAKSISILRSGKIIEKPDYVPQPDTEKNKDSLKEDEKSQPECSQSNEPSQPLPFIPKAPFPQRLIPIKKGSQYGDILEVFKQVSINIPFLDAIKQIPAYSKFLKDLCTAKRNTNVPKKVFLTEQVSSIIQYKRLVKHKDPGCPTIPCIIGDHVINKALLDLGASVNLLPYSVYKQLGLGELKPTSMTLQLADRSVKIPRGIIEDVLVKVDKFYFPVDFVVLDTQFVAEINAQIPIILGRPFLATSNAIINCRNGVLKLSFGNMTVELNVFNVADKPVECDDAYEVNFIDSVTHDFLLSTNKSFEKCGEYFGVNFKNSVDSDNSLLGFTRLIDKKNWKTKVESFKSFLEIESQSLLEPPKLNLKVLREDLRYTFLGEKEILPVIIASVIYKEQEEELPPEVEETVLHDLIYQG